MLRRPAPGPSHSTPSIRGSPRFVRRQPSDTILLCRADDCMGRLMSLGFTLTEARKIPPVPADPTIIRWKDLERQGARPPSWSTRIPSPLYDLALFLFSGGTTAAFEGNHAFQQQLNALALQTNAAGGPILPGDAMLSILPMFHGFGLAVGIHAILCRGNLHPGAPFQRGCPGSSLVRKHRPAYMAGVPTLFDALASNARFTRTPLASFKGLFCGGDSLSRQTKERFEAVVHRNGGKTPLREGYGLTESVTANMLMPRDHYREGSMGIPYPDMLAKVVNPGTTVEAAPREDGRSAAAPP